MAKTQPPKLNINIGVKWLSHISAALLVVGVSLGQLGRLNSYFSFGIYLHDVGIVLGIVLLCWAFYIQHGRQSLKFLNSTLTLRWRLVGAWLLLSVILACLKTNSWIPLFYGLRLGAYGLVLNHFYNFWSHQTKLKFVAIGVLTLVLLGFGFWQYLFLPDMRFLATLSFDDHLYRLIGTWFDPAVTGGLLMLVGLYWFNQIYLEHRMSYKVGLILISLLTVGAVGLTFSRASYLAVSLALVSLSFGIWRNNKSWQPIIMTVVLLIGLVLTIYLAPKPTGEGVKLNRSTSVSARVTNDENLINHLSVKDGLFGQGLFVQTGQSDGVNHARLPNNFFVFLLTNFGAIGSLVLAYLILPKLLFLVRTDPMWFACLIALLMASQFNNLILHPAVWVVNALVLARQSKA